MEQFLMRELSEDELAKYSVLALAHLGDGVFELLVRTHLTLHHGFTSRGLHQKTTQMVCAAAQAKDMAILEPRLTEEERRVFLRGRNAKVKTLPKHASPADYSAATGLEALFGWLYLKNEQDRIRELFSLIVENNIEAGKEQNI